MIAIVAILAAASAGLAGHAAIAALAGALRRYRARYGLDSTAALTEALPHLGPADVRRLALALALAASAAGASIAGVPGAIAGTIFGGAAPPLLVSTMRARWIRRFDRQLIDALETVASGLQAGLSLQQALEAAASGSGSPLREELGLALREIRMGADPDDALDALAARVPSEELALFVAGTTLARQTGGNLASAYRTIAAALRERFRVEGKLRALTAQGRMQGWIIGALPVGLALVLHRLRPDLVDPMLAHPFGWAIVSAVVLLEAAGFFWIRRIVTPTF